MADEEKTVKKAVKKAAVKKAAAKKAAAKQAAPKKAAVAATEAEKTAPKKKANAGVKKLAVTLVRSKNGRLKSHKACVAGLGLRRMHQTVQVIDTPENRGMINKVQYMLNVEEV